MKHAYSTALLFSMGLLLAGTAMGQLSFSEGFDDLSTSGWTVVNKSDPLGTTMWAQGDGVLGVGEGHSGNEISYVWDTYMATDANGTGTISDWLISPATTINNGDSLSLWTISFHSSSYPDRIEVRISPNGGSNVGPDESSVGDFTNLVFSINPDLDNTSYPDIVVDGDTWTYFGAVVSGLSGATSCRIAIRYYIPDGGGQGANGSSVGIDDVSVGNHIAGINEIALHGVGVSPNPTSDKVNVQLPASGNYDVTVFDATGRRMVMEQMSNNGSIDLSSFDTGVYVLEVRDVATNAVSRQRIVKR